MNRILLRSVAPVCLLASLSLLPSCATWQPVKQAPEKQSMDQLLLEWIKVDQDTCSPDKNLVGDILHGASGQTFNNALAAMAFMVMDERGRAERILDFYSAATDVSNTNKMLQNFFVMGQARGFYQNMAIRDLNDAKARHAIWNGDRWLGDMCWLLMAYKQYEKRYDSKRYEHITHLLGDLIVSWYVPQVGGGGYIGSGWRHFDETLHEPSGHAEGNIDAVAALRMIGNNAMADRVAEWLLPMIKGGDRPLDCFTWKVLTFGKDFASDMEDLETYHGYKKTVSFKDRDVVGFTTSKTEDANIWGDGLGHVACAWYVIGNSEKGDYYLGEMEKLASPITLSGRQTMGIPYAAAKTPGFEWVNPDEGFVSCAAWYIFAKHRFNPMRLAP